MEWKPLTTEEATNLKYASITGRDSPYQAILDATEKGPVQVNVPKDGNLQSLKWALSRQIKKSGKKIIMATLADKSGVVLTKESSEPGKK